MQQDRQRQWSVAWAEHREAARDASAALPAQKGAAGQQSMVLEVTFLVCSTATSGRHHRQSGCPTPPCSRLTCKLMQAAGRVAVGRAMT